MRSKCASLGRKNVPLAHGLWKDCGSLPIYSFLIRLKHWGWSAQRKRALGRCPAELDAAAVLGDVDDTCPITAVGRQAAGMIDLLMTAGSICYKCYEQRCRSKSMMWCFGWWCRLPWVAGWYYHTRWWRIILCLSWTFGRAPVCSMDSAIWDWLLEVRSGRLLSVCHTLPLHQWGTWRALCEPSILETPAGMFARASLEADRSSIGLVYFLGNMGTTESDFVWTRCTLYSLDIGKHEQNRGEADIKEILKSWHTKKSALKVWRGTK